jgi:RNA polymerase sigma-70 factor (ECF subfamily)
MTVIDETSADLYSRHAVELTRFATGLVGPSDAADVVSEAITRLMTSRIWSQATNPRALMFRAVLYEARMFHRSLRRRLVREARAASREAYELPSIEPEVARAVAGLSPQQRAVVFLTYWQDLDAGSVADLLGVSEGTVRKQLGRARDKLREVLS